LIAISRLLSQGFHFPLLVHFLLDAHRILDWNFWKDFTCLIGSIGVFIHERLFEERIIFLMLLELQLSLEIYVFIVLGDLHEVFLSVSLRHHHTMKHVFIYLSPRFCKTLEKFTFSVW
jgi:hypothetical protein